MIVSLENLPTTYGGDGIANGIAIGYLTIRDAAALDYALRETPSADVPF